MSLFGVESGSNWSEAVTCATFTKLTPVPGASTVAWNVRLTLLPAAMLRLLHVTVPPANVPPPEIFVMPL